MWRAAHVETVPSGPHGAGRLARKDDGPDPGDRPVILVVDDEQVFRETVVDVVEARLPQAVVVGVSTADEGFEVLEAGPVDVAIVDQRLADIGGVEFLQKARSKGHGLTSIMVTGYPDMDLVKRAKNDARVFRFFPKPVSADVLAEAVADALWPAFLQRIGGDDPASAVGRVRRLLDDG